MQTTIVLHHSTVTPELKCESRDEYFDCRLACMARMIALLDAGIPFIVDYQDHETHDAYPVRSVTLFDEMAVQTNSLLVRSPLDVSAIAKRR